MSKTVMITGSAGFAAAHAVEHYLKTTDWNIVGIDSLKHKGRIERVNYLLGDRYQFVKADLATMSALETLRPFSPDIILNFAAESHVDRSIDKPVPFVQNNVEVMLTMLEYARQSQPSVFIQISTDETFGPMINGHPHPEWDTTLPSNPYSASKAAQEALAIAWWRTYGVPIVITNCMNMAGERQDVEKFIPMTIKKVLAGDTVPVHGTEQDIGTRFYLHARNHADALKFIVNNVQPVKFGEADRPLRYNVVGEDQVSNLEMAQFIAKVIGKPLKYELVDFHSTRPGHDPHYGLDGSKLASLGWKAPYSLEDSLTKAIHWTIANPDWLT